MASIQPLAPSVAEELRAALVISSLQQCAAELVQNSIDANATAIEVKVDVAGHSLHVSDNGDGIFRADMERIGTRYATSKCSTVRDLAQIRTYGFRGEAVAAISEMSLLDIVSRPRNQERAFSTVYKGGERLYCGQSSKCPRYGHGTTISVRDLFYKFPVRQRQWSEASAFKLDAELEKVKRTLETYALVTPRVSFTLIDVAKDSKVLTCRKADSQMHRITTVLGQSLSSTLNVVRTVTEDGVYELSGYISTAGHYSRLHQYIFLNNRPVVCDALHRAMVLIFHQSGFAKARLQLGEDVRRSRERHPVFVLMMKCPPSQYDVCADPTKATVRFEEEDRVIQFARETIIDFLENQHLLSRSAASHLRHQATTGKRRSKLGGGLKEECFPVDYVSKTKTSRPARTKISTYGDPGVDKITLESTDIDTEDELEFELDADWMAAMVNDDYVRNEMQYDHRDLNGLMTATKVGRNRASLLHVGKTMSRSYISSTSGIWAQDALRKWVNPVFPVPPSTIPALQALSLSSMNELGEGSQKGSLKSRISRFFSNMPGPSIGEQYDNEHLHAKSLQLSKAGLHHARVLSQLDLKFILCTVEETTSSAPERQQSSKVLVVIDQHAADERVRVERLMKAMCACSSSTQEYPFDHSAAAALETSMHGQGRNNTSHSINHRLDSMAMVPSLPITLSKREWSLAGKHADWLFRWGITLSVGTAALEAEDLQRSCDLSLLEELSVEAEQLMMSHHFSEESGQVYANETSASVSKSSTTSTTSPHHPTTFRAKHPPFSTCAGESDFRQGYVTTLPRIVADRCVVDHALTQDLIKDSISRLEETRCLTGRDISDVEEDQPDDTSNWQRCIRGCPRAILDVVNSKACRGSIMFNHELSLQQCQELVHDLAQCSFPFQCAHGRPSVVPLTVLAQTASNKQRNQPKAGHNCGGAGSRHNFAQNTPVGELRSNARWTSWMRQ
ncbi:unnamed protein product [Mortierella alpina]